MGLFMDMLNTGNRKRAAREEYEREHPQSDYSSGTSRPRRVRYMAYCTTCGASTKKNYSNPGEALAALQFDGIDVRGFNGCGRDKHSPRVQEVEE